MLVSAHSDYYNLTLFPSYFILLLLTIILSTVIGPQSSNELYQGNYLHTYAEFSWSQWLAFLKLIARNRLSNVQKKHVMNLLLIYLVVGNYYTSNSINSGLFQVNSFAMFCEIFKYLMISDIYRAGKKCPCSTFAICQSNLNCIAAVGHFF